MQGTANEGSVQQKNLACNKSHHSRALDAFTENKNSKQQ